MNRECVYGGTFDPFHNGHEAICLHVLAETAPQGVPLRVIPCAMPALKSNAQASDYHRLAMLESWRLGQKEAARIIVDDIEVAQGQVSYTFETLGRLAQRDPEAIQRVWVMGVDAFNSLHRWHKGAELVQQLNFWVINRPGQTAIRNQLNLKEAKHLDALWHSKAGHFWFDERLTFPEASSEIRQSTHQKPWPVPQTIANYIEQHELYQATA